MLSQRKQVHFPSTPQPLLHSLPLPFTASGGFPRRQCLHSSSALTEPGGSAALPSQAGLRTLPISQPRHRLAARLQGRGKSAAERAGSHAALVPLLQGRALLGRGSTVMQFQKATYLPSDTHKKSNQDFKHSNLHVEERKNSSNMSCKPFLR